MEKKYALIGVAGGGLMGTGIASKLAAAGQAVIIYEANRDSAALIAERCDAIFGELLEGDGLSEDEADHARSLVRVTTDIAPLGEAGLILEAVSEALEIKQKLYADLERCVAPSAIIASSTSGYVPSQLCASMQRQERFLVAHFWNPPHLVPLVEVVPGPATQHWAVQDVTETLKQLGCNPLVLNREIPGFIGNRLQFAVLREALHLLSEGVADAATIDMVMKQSVGRRYAHIGPLEGADIGGLQTFYSIAQYLWPQLARRCEGLELLQQMVERGDVGRRSGRGLYRWDGPKEQWMRRTRLELLRQSGRR